MVTDCRFKKKKITITGTGFEEAEGVLVNQKDIDPSRITMTPSVITANGKPNKLGVVRGINQVRLKLKDGFLSQPCSFSY